ncbi:MAG: class I SAM-dependent methyltransferase [Pseudomonadota bacterium]
MDESTVGEYWNRNADAWTSLSRAGYDTYRDILNTPAFFALLPPVNGLSGLDIGCGEGHNTRLLAARDARVSAVDIAERFIQHARGAEREEPRGIDYHVASASALPFAADTFDFAISTMCLMDVPNTSRALSEAKRVIKPGGFLQFSIAHPCFDTAHRRNRRGADGLTYAIEVGRYFESQQGDISEWTFGSAPDDVRERYQKFRTPRFTRTLSEWMNLVLDAGLAIERLSEPCPTEVMMAKHPSVQDASVVAYFLHIRARA